MGGHLGDGPPVGIGVRSLHGEPNVAGGIQLGMYMLT
jgi:hypothetical protein